MVSEHAPTGSGPDEGPVGPLDLRVSDAERQQVVDALRTHTGAGRLQLDEFEERSGRAFAARTRRDLGVLLRDLPGPGPWASEGPAVTRPGHAAPARRTASEVQPAWPPAGAFDGDIAPRPARSGCGGGRPARPHHRRACWPGGIVPFVVVMAVLSASAGAHLHDLWPVWFIGPWALSMLFGRGRRSGHRRMSPGGEL